MNQPDVTVLWGRMLNKIRPRVNPTTFRSWIKPARLARIDEDEKRLFIEAEHSFAAEWLEAKYSPLFMQVLVEMQLYQYQIVFTAPDEEDF